MHLCIYIYIYVCMHIHIYIYIFIHIYIHIYMHIYTRTYTHAYMHAYTHAEILTGLLTYMIPYTYTHTWARSIESVGFPLVSVSRLPRFCKFGQAGLGFRVWEFGGLRVWGWGVWGCRVLGFRAQACSTMWRTLFPCAGELAKGRLITVAGLTGVRKVCHNFAL